MVGRTRRITAIRRTSKMLHCQRDRRPLRRSTCPRRIPAGDRGMRGDDVSVGVESAFTWKVYSVSAHGKAPLLDFIRKALEARGCKIHHVSAANRAPFHIVFEMPGGERVSLLVYAFLANSKPTRNRPSDEHRF